MRILKKVMEINILHWFRLIETMAHGKIRKMKMANTIHEFS